MNNILVEHNANFVIFLILCHFLLILFPFRPTQNHVASTKTNQYIPDTGSHIYISTQSDPSQDEFKKIKLDTNFGLHTDKTIDCLGFQRAPQFGNNPPKALATGCFYMNQQPGDYTLQWYWEFNPNKQPREIYKSCWDARVVASTGKQPSIPSTGASTVVDTLGAGSTTCRDSWKKADAEFFSRIGATQVFTPTTLTTPTTPVVTPTQSTQPTQPTQPTTQQPQTPTTQTPITQTPVLEDTTTTTTTTTQHPNPVTSPKLTYVKIVSAATTAIDQTNILVYSAISLLAIASIQMLM
jgi:hypothetical protein